MSYSVDDWLVELEECWKGKVHVGQGSDGSCR